MTERMETSAVKIQALVRGHLTRTKLQSPLIAHQQAQLHSTIASLSATMDHCRLTFGYRVQAAAVTIQRVFRGYMVRKQTGRMLREHRKVWEGLRNRSVLVLQCWLRTVLDRKKVQGLEAQRNIGKKLQTIKERLAILTIRKYMQPYIAAYKLKKQKLARKRMRRNMRLEAYLQKQKPSKTATLPTFQPKENSTTPKAPQSPSLEQAFNATQVPFATAIDPGFDDCSGESEDSLALHPLTRTKVIRNYYRPTVAFLQYSAASVVIRPPPKASTVEKRRWAWGQGKGGEGGRRGVKTAAEKVRDFRYLRDTESSQFRYDPEYEFPSVAKPKNTSSKPIPESVKRPTQAWLHFSAHRQSLRLSLENKMKEPTWHYTTRSCGLETLPITPLTSTRGIASPGRSDLSTARTRGRHRPLTSEMGSIGPMMEEDPGEAGMRSGLLSMSTLS